MSLFAGCRFYNRRAGACRPVEFGLIGRCAFNQLVGYGIVVGLNGTGDGNTRLTLQTIQSVSQFGQSTSLAGIKGKNAAAVMVTAELPHEARPNNRCNGLDFGRGEIFARRHAADGLVGR